MKNNNFIESDNCPAKLNKKVGSCHYNQVNGLIHQRKENEPLCSHCYSKNNNFIEKDNLLDKPIKAKTLKKKLEKTLKIKKGMKGYGLKKYKIEPFVKGTYIVGHCYDFKNNEIKTIYDDKPLQNNKPSIELIEKLPVLGADYSCGLHKIAIKINQIIEKLNEHSVRLGEEEDDED